MCKAYRQIDYRKIIETLEKDLNVYIVTRFMTKVPLKFGTFKDLYRMK